MFKNKRKSYSVNAYINFIGKTIKDSKIKEEILEQLETFINEGVVNVDGNNLSGKILNQDGNLYIDIKSEIGKFICSYTKWDLDSMVVIEQETLKSGNYKLTKTDKVKYKTYNTKNTFNTEIIEKIYNRDDSLLYESRTEIEESFNSTKDQIIYRDDSPYINVVDVEKDWHMPNGSIIRYNMNKNELHTKQGIEESFLICKKPYKDDFGTHFVYSNLDKELFASLMSGKITINELLEKLDNKTEVKTIGEKNKKSH